ncbi:MAG TPA: PilC/PilY family type IV pilus protein, partial [Rhodocyclaceae bacterium]|nr:PilC/PilY family type IV pilus protein [Rhodocyclaceae bacterium]
MTRARSKGRQAVQGPWRVGGQGAGGTSYFAIDITDPLNPAYLWEFTHTSLGYTFSNPTVTKLPNGEWAVLFSSGYVLFWLSPLYP